MGVAFGFVVALSAGFLVWLYLVVGAALTLRTSGRVVQLATITRLVGLAFVFPLFGMTGLLLLWGLHAPSVASYGVYVLSIAWGFATLVRAMSDTSGVSWAEASIALIVPIVAVEVLFVVVRLV